MTADLATEHLSEAEAERIPDAPVRAPEDRRRPGRSEHLSPALIELLRLRPNPDMLRGEDREAQYALGTAQGILLGTILGLLTWAGMFWLIEVLLR
jgi:hypothetical protein